MAALEGVLATRDLGYGDGWLSLAAVGLALPFQAKRCYHHSCESDLFQVRQAAASAAKEKWDHLVPPSDGRERGLLAYTITGGP